MYSIPKKAASLRASTSCSHTLDWADANFKFHDPAQRIDASWLIVSVHDVYIAAPILPQQIVQCIALVTRFELIGLAFSA